MTWGDEVLGGEPYASRAAFLDNIDWGTSVRLTADAIVWGTTDVWAANLAWKDRIIGEGSAGNIVWGTINGNAIVRER
jgi:hypothetical protein